MTQDNLLVMEHIHKRFPGVIALNDVQFRLNAGEIHALLGENGAGKSTLIKVLTGVEHMDCGTVTMDGKLISVKSPLEAQKQGISTVYQEVNLCPHLTVAENIFLGREAGSKFNIKRRQMSEEAQKLLDAYEMHIDADMLVEKLTIAQRQMVEIVKAISFNARILVMDEPTSSISDKEVGFLFETIRTLTKKGVGIIYISHKMSELEEICDRVTVMRDGESVGTRVVKETSKDELIAMMVGRELTNYYTRDFQKPGEVILKGEHIADGKMVKDASFELRRGEIIGFAGLVGAGRSETMKAVFGLTPDMKGSVYVEGQPVHIKSPVDALKYGIALVPESRKEEGLYLVQDVQFNSTIEVLGQFIRNFRVDFKKEEEITQKYIDMMATKTPSQQQVIRNLSGGNQQKVMIGRWLATDPKILILDEPTRGVDVGAKAEIYAIMNELVKKGMSIIMISSEMPEIINMSDRVYVMNDGRVTGCLSHEDVTQEKIMQLAAK